MALPPREAKNAWVQGPIFGAVILLSVLGCAARPSPRRWLFFVPIAGLTLVFTFCTKSLDMGSDNGQAAWLLMNMFAMSDFLLLTDVQKVLRKKNQPKDFRIWEAPFTTRLRWGFDLFSSLRGVGWEHEPTSRIRRTRARLSPDRARSSRSGALVQHALGLARCAALYVVGDVASEVSPCFVVDGPAFSAQPWWLRPTVLGYVVSARAVIDGVYEVLAFGMTAVGVTEPGAWQPLFGSFSEAYTVRNLWGRVWHQMMRRFFVAHSDFITSKTGTPRNETARSFMRFFIAFTISGIIHYLADCITMQKCSDSGGFTFFFIQPFGFAIEMFVMWCVRQTGVKVPERVGRIIGYVWVVAWFTVTLPIWVEPTVRSGFMENSGVDIPVVVAIGARIREALGIQG